MIDHPTTESIKSARQASLPLLGKIRHSQEMKLAADHGWDATHFVARRRKHTTYNSLTVAILEQICNEYNHLQSDSHYLPPSTSLPRSLVRQFDLRSLKTVMAELDLQPWRVSPQPTRPIPDPALPWMDLTI